MINLDCDTKSIANNFGTDLLHFRSRFKDGSIAGPAVIVYWKDIIEYPKLRDGLNVRSCLENTPYFTLETYTSEAGFVELSRNY